MFQYSSNGLGRMSRRRRSRRFARVGAAIDTDTLGGLIPADDPPATFTPAEDAELAEGHAAQRTIEHTYHRQLTRRVRRLAVRAPRLERRKVDQLQLGTRTLTAQQRLAGAEAANREMRDHGRHLPRWSRLVIVFLLAAVDVAAYRAAVEIAFDTSDEWPAIIDSYLLALLSVGMVFAAMFAAEQLKSLHTVVDQHREDPASIVDQRRSARRVWMQAGVPALLCAIILLGAGAALRVNALGNVPGWFWIAVPLFSGAALAGAFFVEYKWANKALDERDDLDRTVRRSTRKLRRADRRLARVEGDYRRRQATIEQLWSTFEPSWRVQLEMAGSRIATARSEQPELFHPLSSSVIAAVDATIARGTTRRDGRDGLDRLDLRVDQVLARAAATHRARTHTPTGPIAIVESAAIASDIGPSTFPAPTPPISSNGHHPVAVGSNGHSNGVVDHGEANER